MSTIDIIGSAEHPIMLQTRIKQEGSHVKGTCWITPLSGGRTQQIDVDVDLCQAINAVQKALAECKGYNPLAYDDDVVGLFGPAKNAFNAVVKTGKKAVQGSIVKNAKKVVRSPITGVALTGLAAAFPPVGAPALAGYAAANLVLDQIEAGGKMKRQAQGLVRSVQSGLKSSNPRVRHEAQQARGMLGVADRTRKAQGFVQRSLEKRAMQSGVRVKMPAVLPRRALPPSRDQVRDVLRMLPPAARREAAKAFQAQQWGHKTRVAGF